MRACVRVYLTSNRNPEPDANRITLLPGPNYYIVYCSVQTAVLQATPRRYQRVYRKITCYCSVQTAFRTETPSRCQGVYRKITNWGLRQGSARTNPRLGRFCRH